MLHSQNGYGVQPTYIARYTVPGTQVYLNLRKGDASVVLLWVAAQFSDKVQKIRQSDAGGYNPRSIIGEGSRSISNHASGTAVDLCWRDHPMGKRGTFSGKQRQAIRDILDFCDGVVRWGGDYHGRIDEMHFEINADPSKLAALANKIRSRAVPTHIPPKKAPGNTSSDTLNKGATGNNVRNLQIGLNKVFPSYSHLKADGIFGDATESVVREFQRRAQLTVDGIVGPATHRSLTKFGVTF